MRQRAAVVPGYYLVCYNNSETIMFTTLAVVPGYYLVCYNQHTGAEVPSAEATDTQQCGGTWKWSPSCGK